MKVNTDTKLIVLVRALEELPGILKLVRRYLTSSGKTRQLNLLNFLLKNEYRLENTDKEKMLAAIAPGLSDKAYRTVAWELTKLLEETMIDFEMKNNGHLYKRLMAISYQSLGLDSHFFKAARACINEGLPEKEQERHRALSIGNELIFFHPSSDLNTGKEIQNHFDSWFLNAMAVAAIIYLKYYCISWSRKLIFGKEPLAGLEENFEKFICALPDFVKELLIIKVLLKAAYAAQSLKYEDYLLFKEGFVSNKDKLKSNHGFFVAHLLNVLNFVETKEIKAAETFELYEIGVKEQYFIHAKRMPTHIYNNIVYFACEMKKADWAKKFANRHIVFLSEKKDYLEETLKLSNFLIDFARGNYENALQSLEEVKYLDVYFGIRIYATRIKCLYELRDTMTEKDLETSCRVFLEYLSRKDHISQQLITRIKNFTRLVKLLVMVPYDDKKKTALLKELKEGHIYFEQKWMQEKVEELKLK